MKHSLHSFFVNVQYTNVANLAIHVRNLGTEAAKKTFVSMYISDLM